MPAKRDRDRDIDSRITGGHEIKAGEKICRITADTSGGFMCCLIPGCPFYIHVAAAPWPVMQRELRDFYRDHRKHRHPEYRGKTQYDYRLGDGWLANVTPSADKSQLNQSQG